MAGCIGGGVDRGDLAVRRDDIGCPAGKDVAAILPRHRIVGFDDFPLRIGCNREFIAAGLL